jgi:hypothetical protein
LSTICWILNPSKIPGSENDSPDIKETYMFMGIRIPSVAGLAHHSIVALFHFAHREVLLAVDFFPRKELITSNASHAFAEDVELLYRSASRAFSNHIQEVGAIVRDLIDKHDWALSHSAAATCDIFDLGRTCQ